MRRTRAAATTTVLVAAVALAGCGQERTPSSSSSPSASPTSAADAAGSQPWLFRVDTYSGEDGETKQATYVTVVPKTGETSVVRMPRLQVAEASGDQRVLLVDAAHHWALLDNRPAKADRAKGVVRLTNLTDGGSVHTYDVRRATGRPGLVTAWASFDPTKPGLLRVVDGRDVWLVDVDDTAKGSARKEGVLPARTGWIYGGGFAVDTGLPYIEDIDSFKTLPAGNGEMTQRAVRRAGGRLLISDNGRYPGLPAPGCDLSSGFVQASGQAWAFCTQGRHVQVRVLAAGTKEWKDYGTPTKDVLPYAADPAFVLPVDNLGS